MRVGRASLYGRSGGVLARLAVAGRLGVVRQARQIMLGFGDALVRPASCDVTSSCAVRRTQNGLPCQLMAKGKCFSLHH